MLIAVFEGITLNMHTKTNIYIFPTKYSFLVQQRWSILKWTRSLLKIPKYKNNIAKRGVREGWGGHSADLSFKSQCTSRALQYLDIDCFHLTSAPRVKVVYRSGFVSTDQPETLVLSLFLGHLALEAFLLPRKVEATTSTRSKLQ